LASSHIRQQTEIAAHTESRFDLIGPPKKIISQSKPAKRRDHMRFALLVNQEAALSGLSLPNSGV
jgi:hypothetical protein